MRNANARRAWLWIFQHSSLLNKTRNKVTSNRRRDLIGSQSWRRGIYFTAPRWFQWCSFKNNEVSLLTRCANQHLLTVSGSRVSWTLVVSHQAWQPYICPPSSFSIFNDLRKHTGQVLASGRKMNLSRSSCPKSPTHRTVPRGKEGNHKGGLEARGLGKSRLIPQIYT